LWETLRGLLHNHRAFPDAQWALPEDQLEGIEKAYKALEPAEFVERSAWLFASLDANLPNPTPNDWRADEQASAALRHEVVKKLLAQGDAESILALASVAKTPGLVGFVTVEAEGRLEWKDQILISALHSSENAKLDLAYGMIGAFCRDKGVVWAVDFLKRRELREWSRDRLSAALLLMPPSQAIWDSIARFGKEVEDEYWSQVGTLRIGNDSVNVHFAIEKLLSAGRAQAAVPLAGRHGGSLPSELLIRVLTQAAQETWPKNSGSNDTTMFIFWIETLLKRLDQAEDVSETQIARLEWLYLAVLEHSRRPPVMLHTVMASSPEFFVKVLSAVYGPDAKDADEQSNKDDEVRARAVASQAHNLLRSWHAVPGLKAGAVDEAQLEDWTKRVRLLCSEAGIEQIGDQHIGQVLASAPLDADGVWPAKPVRELIEATRSRNLELGILVGIQNGRGVTRRGLLDGGVQERSIAKRYREWGRATELDWHRTSALLERVAQSFEERGQWHDQNAERTDWTL